MHDFVVPALAVGVMLIFAAVYWRLISIQRTALKRRLGALISLVDDSDGTDDGPPYEPASTAKSDLDETARSLWKEWEASLVHSNRHELSYRTLDAEDVFTPERLAPDFTRFRGISAAPGIFTGLGVLGTFIGLSVGFGGLNLTENATGLDNIVASAGNLVSAAAVAFTASIAGVLLSLVFNIAEKQIEQISLIEIAAFQHKINQRYRLLTPEHSLIQIADSQKQSTEALQELHERIGNRLQEALEQQSTTIRDQLSASIAESLAPAMQTLVTATTTQSSAVFESLIERFASSFTELGAQQRSAMDDSANRLQAAIDGLGERVSSVTEELRAQSAELAERQKEVLQSLEQMSGALTSSTTDLDSTASSLAVISERFDQSSKALASDLSHATTSLEAVFAKVEEQANHGAELTAQTAGLAVQISDTSTKLVTAAVSMSTELDRFSDVQDGFRTNLEGNAKALADSLRTHVEQLSQQVASWLGNYSVDVERQIESRMETWNSVSQDYAAKMFATAQALNDAVDELSSRDSPAVEVVA